MLAYTIRKIVYNIPIYLAVVLLMMMLLRVRDPVAGQLGKNASAEEYAAKKSSWDLIALFGSNTVICCGRWLRSTSRVRRGRSPE